MENAQNLCCNSFWQFLLSFPKDQKPKDIANAFREHYMKTFINSAKNAEKVSQFNKMWMNYVGNIDTGTFVTIENIETAIKNL